MMNAQEVFDKVVTHLLTQKEQASDKFGCRYRHYGYRADEPILMCAVGCLIPDEEYKIVMEDRGSIAGLLHYYQTKMSNSPTTAILREHFQLLQELQLIHDGRSVIEWRRKLKQAAKQFKLKQPPLLKPRLRAEERL